MFNHSISRRRFVGASAASLGLVATAGLGLTGCGGSDAGKNGELNLFIWTEYVPEDLISDFEKESGVKVNVSMFSTNEEMLSKYKSGADGAYDIVQPTGYMVQNMIGEDLLQKIDTSKLENFGNIGSQYLNKDYDPDNRYSVPYMAVCTALAYDKSKVDEPKSWDDLWGDQFKKEGLVSLDDPQELVPIVALTLGFDPNTTDTAELDQVKEKLLELKDSIKVFDSDSPKSALINGDVAGGDVWTAEIGLANRENPNIQVCYPSEGCGTGIDNWCITHDAKNQENALKFIDFMLRPESAKRVSEDYPYVQVNTAAIDLLGDDYKDNKIENVPAEVFEKGFSAVPLDDATLKIYNEMWTELKK